MKSKKFASQSEILIEQLMKDYCVDESEARCIWYNSRTYKEIVKKNLLHITAMNAYLELQLELSNNPQWFNSIYD